MNIYFRSLPYTFSRVDFIFTSISPLKQKIAMVAIAAFVILFNLTYCFFLYHRFKIQTSSDIPPRKVRALAAYKKDPEKCGKMPKSAIFREIKYIELPIPRKRDITSVVGLMLYLSGLNEIDLNDPVCARIVLDTFKECNKETSDQLADWLNKQKTVNIPLLKDCFTLFIHKYEQQIPFSPYSIELLIKIYKERNWNQARDSEGHLFLPCQHELIVSVMAVLIEKNPNEDRVIALAEWIIKQPEYNLQTCKRWSGIFQKKEIENSAVNLYYPLFNTMMTHFKKDWLPELASLDPKLANYLRSKDPTLETSSEI